MRISHGILGLACVAAFGVYWSCSTSSRLDGRSEALTTVGPPTAATIDVLTQRNDNGRTGANTSETLLSASGAGTITNTNFGELWRLPVDGQVAAQPLYVGNYTVAGHGSKNVLIVATMNNTVYAFDADSDSATSLWTYHADAPFVGYITNNKPTGHNAQAAGILSTPVIDKTRPVTGKPAGAIYAMEMIAQGTGSDFVLVEISLFDGSEVARSPRASQIAALAAAQFDPNSVLNRPGLLLSSGFIYAAFGSRAEPSSYRGWVLRFDVGTLQLASPGGFYQSTTGTGTAQAGGIWQAGSGLVADGAGNVYFTTGNGNFDPPTYCRAAQGASGAGYDPHATPNNCSVPILTQPGMPASTPIRDEDSIVKLDAALNRIAAYAPRGSIDPPGGFGQDFQTIEACDGDFGSAGPVLFSQTVGGTAINRLVAGGKTGQMFVLDPGAMSGRNPLDGTGAMTQAAFQGTVNAFISDPQCYDKGYVFGPHIHGSPAYLHTQTGGTSADYLFVWGEKDYPVRFTVSSGAVNPSGLRNTFVYDSLYTDGQPANGMPGGALSVSSNGSDLQSAIVWASVPSKGACGANDQCDIVQNQQLGIVTGDLLAFRASDMALIWGTRNFHAADSPDLSWGAHLSRSVHAYTKFMPPTVANGKVFVATSAFNVSVYGLRTAGTSNTASSFAWSACAGDLYSGDVDGDGADDLICHHRSGASAGNVDIAFGSHSGSLPRATTSQVLHWCYPSATTPDPRLYVGDFDGDGRADLLCHDFINGNDFIAYSNGGTTTPYDVASGADWTSVANGGYAWCRAGYSCKNSGHYGQSCVVGNGQPSDALCGNVAGSCQNDYELVPGDYNGDGHTDLMCHHTTSSVPLVIRTAQLGAGAGDGPFHQSFSWTSSFSWCFDNGTAGSAAIPWHDTLAAGDIDGDGLDDLLCHRPSDGFKFVAYNKMDRTGPPGSHPAPQFTGTDWSAALNWCDDFNLAGNSLDAVRLDDLDGDGLADMTCQNYSTGQQWVLYGNHVLRSAAPFHSVSDWSRPGAGWCNGTTGAFPSLVTGDIDGDGRKDFVCHDPAAGQEWYAYYPIVGMTR